MELRHLRYFVAVAVAEELHFTRAALRLNLAQPPLSLQIQALEAELGVELLARSRRKVALTEAGARFLLRARQILAAAETATLEAQRAGRGELGELRIGFTASLPLTQFFPGLIYDYRQHFPQVTLTLVEMSSARRWRLNNWTLALSVALTTRTRRGSYCEKSVAIRCVWQLTRAIR